MAWDSVSLNPMVKAFQRCVTRFREGRVVRRFGFVMGGLLVGLGVVELWFRWFVPVCEMPFVRYLEEYQILTYDPDLQREGVYTAGSHSEIKGRWRINNAGWNSRVDYVKEKHRPRIAIIGDSYVEAFQVDLENSFPELLRTELGDQVDIYQFGISGATLAGYLRISRYVREQYDPDVLIFNLCHNDFVPSVALPGDPKSIRSRVLVDGNVTRELAPKPYQPSFWRRLLARSDFVRFLVFNREILLRNASHRQKQRQDLEKQNPKGERFESARKVLRYVVEQIANENPGRRLVFVLDADRNAIYRGKPRSLAMASWAEELSLLTGRFEGEFVDLQTTVRADFEANGVPLSFEIDYHWNRRGHRVVAEELLSTSSVRRVVND